MGVLDLTRLDASAIGGIGRPRLRPALDAGRHLADAGGFFAEATGSGVFSGTSLDFADGILSGRCGIDGPAAAYLRFYDDGRRAGLVDEALERFVALRLARLRSWDAVGADAIGEARSLGFGAVAEDAPLHRIGTAAMVLAPGQRAVVTGAWRWGRWDDPALNRVALHRDADGLAIDYYRVGGAEHDDPRLAVPWEEDVVLAARVLLSPEETRRFVEGADDPAFEGGLLASLQGGPLWRAAMTILRERIAIDSGVDGLTLTDGALRMMARIGRPLYP
ncbi:MAG TPA: hypothetical protein VEA41_19510 [Salinarimonas sp.]|nr:hypothetical protein [Salinarimonas sp.]